MSHHPAWRRGVASAALGIMREIRHAGAPRTLGTCLAVCWFVLCLQSCLITDKIELQDPVNHRPSIISQPTAVHPTTQIISLDLTEVDAPVVVPLEVVIRDANLWQVLEVRVLLDGDTLIQEATTNDPLADGASPPTEDRLFERMVDVTVLSDPGCHRLDMVVSGGFQDFDVNTSPRTPIEDGDFAVASWFVRTTTVGNPTVDLDRCPVNAQ